MATNISKVLSKLDDNVDDIKRLTNNNVSTIDIELDTEYTTIYTRDSDNNIESKEIAHNLVTVQSKIVRISSQHEIINLLGSDVGNGYIFAAKTNPRPRHTVHNTDIPILTHINSLGYKAYISNNDKINPSETLVVNTWGFFLKADVFKAYSGLPLQLLKREVQIGNLIDERNHLHYKIQLRGGKSSNIFKTGLVIFIESTPFNLSLQFKDIAGIAGRQSYLNLGKLVGVDLPDKGLLDDYKSGEGMQYAYDNLPHLFDPYALNDLRSYEIYTGFHDKMNFANGLQCKSGRMEIKTVKDTFGANGYQIIKNKLVQDILLYDKRSRGKRQYPIYPKPSEPFNPDIRLNDSRLLEKIESPISVGRYLKLPSEYQWAVYQNQGVNLYTHTPLQVDKFIQGTLGIHSSGALATITDNTIGLCAKTDGGRITRSDISTYRDNGRIIDVDIVGAYNHAIAVTALPLGNPVKISHPLNSVIERVSLRDFLSTHHKDLCRDAYAIWVSTDYDTELNFQQHLIPSNLVTINRGKLDNKHLIHHDINSDLNPRSIPTPILTNVIENGVITSDILDVIYYGTHAAQRDDLLDNLYVVAAIFYPLSRRCETIQEFRKLLYHEGLLPVSSSTWNSDTNTTVNTLSQVSNWGAYPTKDLAETYQNERVKYPKGSPENAFLKLLSNGAYGDFASPYFAISNPVYANVLTAKVRTMVYCLESGLHTHQTITDGGTFNSDKVTFPIRSKYLNIDDCVNGNGFKPDQNDNYALRSGPLLPPEFDWNRDQKTLHNDICERILDHVKSVFPTGENGIQVLDQGFKVEIKRIFDTVILNKMGDYGQFKDDKLIECKARSHRDKGVYRRIPGQDKWYGVTSIAPKLKFFESLYRDSTKVESDYEYLDTDIISCSDITENEWQRGKLPGDTRLVQRDYIPFTVGGYKARNVKEYYLVEKLKEIEISRYKSKDRVLNLDYDFDALVQGHVTELYGTVNNMRLNSRIYKGVLSQRGKPLLTCDNVTGGKDRIEKKTDILKGKGKRKPIPGVGVILDISPADRPLQFRDTVATLDTDSYLTSDYTCLDCKHCDICKSAGKFDNIEINEDGEEIPTYYYDNVYNCDYFSRVIDMTNMTCGDCINVQDCIRGNPNFIKVVLSDTEYTYETPDCKECVNFKLKT